MLETSAFGIESSILSTRTMKYKLERREVTGKDFAEQYSYVIMRDGNDIYAFSNKQARSRKLKELNERDKDKTE